MVEIFDTSADVARLLSEIVALQAHARALIHPKPHPKFSPAG